MFAFRKSVPALAAFIAIAAPAPVLALDPFGGEEHYSLHDVGDAVVADFDGDGWADVMATDAGILRYLRNAGAGNLVETTCDPVGQVLAVAAADLDADGLSDLAFTWWDGSRGEVGVMRARRDGWDPQVRMPLGDRPFDLQIADMDGDGRRDLVVLSESSISVFLGRGSMAFGPRIDSSGIPYEIRPSDRLHLADMNRDGLIDAFVTPGSRTWREVGFCPFSRLTVPGILLGRGDGTFGSAIVIATHPRYDSPSVPCDLDQDGWTDFVIGQGSRVIVAWNDRSGTFQFPELDTLGEGECEEFPSILVSDFDGDGIQDILSSVSDGLNHSRLAWYRGLGGRRFAEAPSPLLSRGRFWDVVELIEAGDLDRDRVPDVVSARWPELFESPRHEFTSSLGVLRHRHPGTFLGWNSLPIPLGRLEPVELERNGRLELVQAQDERIAHWTFDEQGRLRELDDIPVAGPIVDIADLDDDGRSDFVVGRGNDVDIVIMGPGGPRPAERWNDVALVAPGQLDGRPGLDLLVRDGSWTPSMLVNDGSGHFTRAPIEGLPVERTGQREHTGDLDGDGLDEILIVSPVFAFFEAPDTIVAYSSRGGGRYERFMMLPLTRNYHSESGTIRVLDLEGDGSREIVALFGAADAHGLEIVYPDGRPQQVINAWEGAHRLAIADFDRDRRLDIAFLSVRDEVDFLTLTLCFGRADGGFTIETRNVTWGHGGAIAGDVDGDGATDLVASQSMGRTGAAILLNRAPVARRAVVRGPGTVRCPRLSIAGVNPNPARADVALRFAAAAAGPVRLELFDVAGRRVHDETFALATAGAQTIRFTPRRDLPAGLYLVRAATGGESAIARLAIVR